MEPKLAFDKKTRETGPPIPSKEEVVDMQIQSFTCGILKRPPFSIENLVKKRDLEKRTSTQSRMVQAQLDSPICDNGEASKHDMSVDSIRIGKPQ